MMDTVQNPETKPKANGDGTVTTHPAYAQISASRISGSAHLYGSDFAHHNFVRIRISRSELHRSLANDWPFADSVPYIEVDLSEAQWAGFVSSLNLGSGIQCTVRRLGGETVPAFPAPASRVDQFGEEMSRRVQAALEEVDSLAKDIAELKISDKAKKALLARVQGAHRNLESNTKFVAQQFDEHMEGTVEKAKIEVNAYAVQALMRAGLEASGNQGIGFTQGDIKQLASDS